MPHLETPEELAEHLADRLGVYGAHGDERNPEGVTCTDEKPCRPCFVMAMAERIRRAVKNERIMKIAEAVLAQDPPSISDEEKRYLEELRRKIPDGQASPL